MMNLDVVTLLKSFVKRRRRRNPLRLVAMMMMEEKMMIIEMMVEMTMGLCPKTPFPRCSSATNGITKRKQSEFASSLRR